MNSYIQFTFSAPVVQRDNHTVTMALAPSDIPLLDTEAYNRLTGELTDAESDALREELEKYCLMQIIKRSITTTIVEGIREAHITD